MSNRPNRPKLCSRCNTFPRQKGVRVCGPCKLVIYREGQEQLRRAGDLNTADLDPRPATDRAREAIKSLGRSLRGDR